MSNENDKVSTLVIRLANKTRAGLISWETFTDGKTFQTRQGDYVIKLWADTFGHVESRLLQSTRLDGKVVFTASTNQNLVAIGSDELTRLHKQGVDSLNVLYDHLRSQNSDLDALLKLI